MTRTPTWIRFLVVVYIAVLWMAVAVSVRPAVVGVPVIGPVLQVAARSLEALTLVPGIPVFTAPGREWNDWVTSAICMTFTGHRAGTGPVELYAPECPPTGMQWRHDPFDELMQYTTRHLDLGDLLDPKPVTHPSRFPEATRRFVMLGDYFCHSPLVAPPDLTSLTLRWTLQVRHYQTGDFAEQTLVCNWLCDQPETVVPQCTMKPMKKRAAARSRGA